MSGYTPVFNTVFDGSLCGRYPDTAAWMFFLALADWRGEVDKTPEYIAGVTGMPLADLKACIERFMQPDPRSRSQAEEGRKLVLIDPARDWGWRVVNIQLYRTKASGQDQIADGRNAAKVRRYKDRHRGTPQDTTGHPETPTHTADTNSNIESKKARNTRATRLPADFSADLEYARSAIPDIDAEAEFARFCDYWRAKSGANGTKADWPATWRNWIRTCSESGKYARRKEASRATNGLPVLNG